MKPCKLIIKDEVNIKLVGLPVEIRRLLAKEFKYIVPHAKFSPAYRLGRWDGAVNFFGIGGDGYLYHLDRILEILTTNNFEISEIEDRRRPINIDFPKVTDDFWGDTCWPAGHPMAGQPIRIRPHQLEALQLFSENPQCIQSLPTSSGKCLTGDTLLTVKTSADSFPKTLPIIDLINHIERELGIRLFDNIEVELGSFKVSVDTPQGEKEITHVIKKENLDILKIVFDSGYELKAASSHILRSDDNDVFLSELRIGDYVDHKNGILTIVDIIPCESEDCYDIAVSNPHYFYDANGLIHHNTIITATMAKLCEPYGRTVTIVPSTSLVEQTGEDFRNCGLDVGLYYGTRKDLNKTHTICTWQSLSALRKKDKVIKEDGVSSTLTLTDFLNNVVGVIIDEAHGLKAAELQQLMLTYLNHAPIRWALTGTIPKEVHSVQCLYTSVGPLVHKLAAKTLQDAGVLSTCVIRIQQLIDLPAFKSYPDEVKYLVTNKERLAYIANMISNIAETGNTLVLVNRIETGTILCDYIDGAVFVSGEVKTKDRKEEYDAFQVEKSKVLIATSGVAAVGINIISLYNLVLIEPGKSFVRVIQSIGRGLRKGFEKDHVEVWDIASTCKYSKRHLTERKRFYKEAEYPMTLSKIKWD